PPSFPSFFCFVFPFFCFFLPPPPPPPLEAPLSGQRALTREAWQRIGRLDPGFGLEMGLNLDALRHRLRLLEVETEMKHRRTGRDLRGFLHRGRQFRDVALAIARRWPLQRSAGPSSGETVP
ncbi:MAG: hypothetical protein ACK47B_18270, partial [Armatimonadota bacterium]